MKKQSAAEKKTEDRIEKAMAKFASGLEQSMAIPKLQSVFVTYGNDSLPARTWHAEVEVVPRTSGFLLSAIY